MSTAATPAEPAKSTGERALAAVPVILTVMATILAGLSSSEMTQSMYYRSLAAQYEAKAGSQWAFFQAKRIRGTTMEGSGDMIRALADPPPFDITRLTAAVAQIESSVKRVNGPKAVASAAARLQNILDSKGFHAAAPFLIGPALPTIVATQAPEEKIQEIIRAIESRQTEKQTSQLVAQVPVNRIEITLELSEANAAAFDAVCEPVTSQLREIEIVIASLGTATRNWQTTAASDGDPKRREAADEAAVAAREIVATLAFAKQDFTSRRYAKEAAFNQESAELNEIFVRRTGAQSERHRNRSRNFFYAMLCAQAGVTISAFALARSRKSWFWAVAGAAGLIAVSFGAYVYLAI